MADVRSSSQPSTNGSQSDELQARLVRLERKTNVLLVLVSITIAMPLLRSAVGIVQWTAVILFVLIVAALVMAFFRNRLPHLIRKGGRWAVERALADPASEQTASR